MRRGVRCGSGISLGMNWLTSLPKKVKAQTIWESDYGAQRKALFVGSAARVHLDAWATILLLMNDERLTPEQRRTMLDLLEQAALHDYPNPERIGCPGADFL